MNVRPLFAAALLPLLVALGTAHAADRPVRLRGELTAVSDTQATVQTADGSSTTVLLNDKLRVLDVTRTSLDAIADKAYLGVAGTAADADGKVRALGVMVFPEDARGRNEGHFPWDSQANATMTNATVSRLVKKPGGAEIDMRYGQQTRTIVVDSNTSFGQWVGGSRTLLVKGAKVMVIGTQPDGGGAMTGGTVFVGRDGFVPPI